LGFKVSGFRFKVGVHETLNLELWTWNFNFNFRVHGIWSLCIRCFSELVQSLMFQIQGSRFKVGVNGTLNFELWTGGFKVSGSRFQVRVPQTTSISPLTLNYLIT
jgi:hypothetical protein